MKDIHNIILVGVGGQGTILASKILSSALMDASFDVKMSEVHGMAQRGGSVSTQVRFGEKVLSPLFGKGSADILVSFEEMEALRWLDYLKPDGEAIINRYNIPSAPVLSGNEDYPEGITGKISEKVKTKSVEAFKIAKECGNVRSLRTLFFSAFSLRLWSQTDFSGKAQSTGRRPLRPM